MFKLLVVNTLLMSSAFVWAQEEKTSKIQEVKEKIKEKIEVAQVKEDAKKEVLTYDRLLNSKYSLFPHKGTYLLPVSYNASAYPGNDEAYVNRLGNDGELNKKLEAEFQISFLLPIYRKIAKTEWDIVVAYTHHSWWQIYNEEWSRPFRETNYTPELFGRRILKNPLSLFNFQLIGLDVGYMHQSNGQVQLLSRSWDRLFVRGLIKRGPLSMTGTLWWRIPETGKKDDNPTIHKYMGYGELEAYQSFGKHTVGLKVPIAWDYYSVDLKYSYPWKDQWRFFVNARSGYGHSLIDYNRETQRIGVGIILEDFMDESPTQAN